MIVRAAGCLRPWASIGCPGHGGGAPGGPWPRGGAGCSGASGVGEQLGGQRLQLSADLVQRCQAALGTGHHDRALDRGDRQSRQGPGTIGRHVGALQSLGQQLLPVDEGGPGGLLRTRVLVGG